MITRYAFVPCLVLLASNAFAQPNFATGSLSYAPGDSYILHQGLYFTPHDDGIPNAVWDHSDLISSATATDQWVAPPTGGPSGSTVAEVMAPGAYAFYKATATSFQQMGLVTPQATMNCADPISTYPYPLTFGTTMEDTYSCTGNSSGMAFTRNGTFDIVGTSWGTLIMPYGTFNNVLMVSIEQYHEDVFTSSPDDGSGYSATIQLFVRPGVKAPLLANYLVYTIPGPVYSYSRFLDATSVGVEEAQRNAIGIDLMPNPASGIVEVAYGVPAGSTMNVELLDITGKVVLHQDRNTIVTGVQREIIDIGGLAPGVYTVRITDGNGASGTKRLVVQ